MLSSVASGKHSDFGKIAFIAGDQTHCLNQATHITPASRHFDLLKMVAVHIQIYDTYDMNGHFFTCDGFTTQAIQPGRVVYLATEKERESPPAPRPGKWR